MITYELLRSYLPDRTIGKLSYGIYTMEPQWLDNAVNLSCIPEGVYIVRRDKVGRFKYYAFENVDGRTFIEIHGGTNPKHTNGCLLVGTGFDKNLNLAGSGDALEQLLKRHGDESFKIIIRQFNPYTDKW